MTTKLSSLSFSRGLERGENSCIRPLSQFLLKRKLQGNDLLFYSSQQKIEVMTTSNFVVRKHYPVANPFKDFPKFQTTSFETVKKSEIPKRFFQYHPKKSATVKIRRVFNRTSNKTTEKCKKREEQISGWAGLTVNKPELP